MTFIWQKSEKSEKFANFNFSLFVWVSGLQIVTARTLIDAVKKVMVNENVQKKLEIYPC